MPVVLATHQLSSTLVQPTTGYSLLITIIGGFFWTSGITLLSYIGGQIIPNVDKYLISIILVIGVVALTPSIFHLY